MKIAILAAATVTSLTACSAGPAAWQTETVPVILSVPAAPAVLKIAGCAPLDAGLAVEAHRITPLKAVQGAGIDALTAALMRSEAEKNARLRQALLAYERCRGHP